MPETLPNLCGIKTLLCICSTAHSLPSWELFEEIVHVGLAKGWPLNGSSNIIPQPTSGYKRETSQDTFGDAPKGRQVGTGAFHHLPQVRGAWRDFLGELGNSPWSWATQRLTADSTETRPSMRCKKNYTKRLGWFMEDTQPGKGLKHGMLNRIIWTAGQSMCWRQGDQLETYSAENRWGRTELN